MDRAAFAAECQRIGLELREEQFDAFEVFENELYEANEVMNLTRVAREECWLRHFLDSLLFHDQIPVNATILDLGTGPGFPAWPLACARPDLQVTALDSSGKMLGFLQRHPLPNLKPVLARAEDWGVRDRFDFVIGRAIAPLGIQIELSAAPCRKGGLIGPMRTESDAAEIERLRKNPLGLVLDRVERRILPRIEAPRLMPIWRKQRSTPARYPRAWAEIKRDPL
jgi:16S rRNA (guanine527-N7)-methyltransferase